MPTQWFKILQPGVLLVRTPRGRMRRVVFTPHDVRNCERIGNAKLRAGWQIPVCWDHQEVGPVQLSIEERNAKLVQGTIGYIDEFRVIDGILQGKTNIPDPKDAKRAKIVSHTSPLLDWDWLDNTGHTWTGCTVQHLAITNRPVPFFASVSV